MSQDLFGEITNAVLDLQSAQLQTYERPLKRLAQLLKEPELQPYNEELTNGLDLDEFIKKSEQTGGSMIGSSKLLWPEDHKQTLGLHLLLIEKLGGNPEYAIHFGFRFFHSGRKVISGIHSLTGQLIIPFIRDYKSFIQSKGGFQRIPIDKTATPLESRPITNFGVMVMNSQNVSMKNIHNLAQMNSDKTIARAFEALANAISEADIAPKKSAEMLEQVEALAEQATLAPNERKSGIIKACWKQLVENADGIANISDLLAQHGPAIAGFFETALARFS